VSRIDKFGFLIDPSADVLETTYPEVDLLDPDAEARTA
jgi:hypothetical protein